MNIASARTSIHDSGSQTIVIYATAMLYEPESDGLYGVCM